VTTPVRTLIVDDDVPTRVGLRTILSSEPGIVVVGQAATGAEACAMADELLPDVVLMDVQLPDFDGIEATNRIMAALGERAPYVIVLTTFDDDEYLYRSMRAGARGFLLKRTRAEDLADAVRTVATGASLPMPAAMASLIDRHARLADAPGAAPTRFQPPLTEREADVMVLIARGLSNSDIAQHLSVSVETVRTHVKHVYAKCGARDRAQAVIAAYESGLVPPFS
jgi:DNA-binding NarL/FixJ family response regulator